MASPRVLSIPVGAPFLPTLADALIGGVLIPDFSQRNDPLGLADVTIYVPTRRAARELRRIFAEKSGAASAILPTVRPLGESDEDDALFDTEPVAGLDLAPPISPLDRLLALAPLVRAWKSKLPHHVAELYDEAVVIPTSTADSVWLARDLARLIDDVETEGSDWGKLADLAVGELAGWWQVTLTFLEIVTHQWPEYLASKELSNPAAHRNALLAAQSECLARNPPLGPVVAAGSTGSIPATAQLLSVIARLPRGAVVLPGLDRAMDARSWSAITRHDVPPAVLGHPQYGFGKLLAKLQVAPEEVVDIGTVAPVFAHRAVLVGEALRPAETTDVWAERRAEMSDADIASAFAGVMLVEAANERDEAAAIAVALRQAIETPGRKAALVTGDRNLARRVSTELLRFGVRADDSGGTPLGRTPPGELLLAMLHAVFQPGDPVAVLSLLKHPLLSLGLERPLVRRAAEVIELVALRGGVGRPDILHLKPDFEARLLAEGREPFWMSRMTGRRLEEAGETIARLEQALAPLGALRDAEILGLDAAIRTTVTALEALGRDADGGVSTLYALDAGERLAEFLRGLVAASAPLDFAPAEWPDLVEALIAPEIVRPTFGVDRNVAIWGQLEARLQGVDTLVVGGLNEGAWPGKPRADRFLSRTMRGGIDLEPPERRIGLAAHDFQMALGAPEVVLTRSARADDAPAVASRWLQRLLTFLGPEPTNALRVRGDALLGAARALDAAPKVDFARRPSPKPPLVHRPKRFSVTEIETLRRDPYAIYARRILGLSPLEPLVRDPGAAERGTLFHAILHRFSQAIEADGERRVTREALLEAADACFAQAALPADVEAIWRPRFEKLANEIVDWEAAQGKGLESRRSEELAMAIQVGATGVTLSGRADRIDLRPGGLADILDYKTGASPSKGQAHTLLSPQLALEGALLMRGAFREAGARQPADMVFIRMKPNGTVDPESILEYNGSFRTAAALSEDAWGRLERLLVHYQDPATGYLARALPFRVGETDGDYDHLARVLEWSAGGDGEPEEGAIE